MVRGVSFKAIPSSYMLYQILKCISIEKYYWYNIDSQSEVWDKSRGTTFFEKEIYDGKSFFKRINVDHFIIFLKLQAYFTNSSFVDIHNYEEFKRSDCQLILLIYDCQYVEIYAKNQTVSKEILENALTNHYTEIQYITDSNDGRTKMDVL